MDSVTNYWLLWTVYLVASTGFFVVFWRMTRSSKHAWFSYLVRGTAIAIALTPWYANQESPVRAPALMIVLLDTITIGGTAAVRALVPLVLAIMLAWIVASGWYLLSIRIHKINHK